VIYFIAAGVMSHWAVADPVGVTLGRVSFVHAKHFVPVASGIQSDRGSFRADYRRYDPKKYGQMINPRTAFQNERPRKPIVKSQPMNQITPAKPPAAVDLHFFCSSDMCASFSSVQSKDKSYHALMASILH